MSSRSESGESLIETIIAIAVLGIAVTAILGSIATGIVTSVVNRDQTDANALLLRSAEVLKSPAAVASNGNPYVSCAQTADYNPTRGLTVPSGWTVTLTTIQYWNGSAWRPRTGGADTCLGADGLVNTSDDEWSGSEHLQKLTLTVTQTSNVTSRTLDVLKGNS